ncbi:hypothetical protein ACH24_06090 [Francisella persica ATCC VR-331]|uniref:Uncharacterized protein n=1 Tax=Francisella persica ATCC VR-331 TaxID=1086726 RepID=A0AAC8ZMY0_9GAMM|nr:hypothetical protein [Francisella persica]ALB02161.1 hypothetical protein ACH24_06090 [Francisella persica ATCC VR-331]ANH77423.1 hypothetical protein FSC845_02180 [Francisella persica ATCC VR-331]
MMHHLGISDEIWQKTTLQQQAAEAYQNQILTDDKQITQELAYKQQQRKIADTKAKTQDTTSIPDVSFIVINIKHLSMIGIMILKHL